jgi:RNA polymerase sigma-70 factor (ECF subfamily)
VSTANPGLSAAPASTEDAELVRRIADRDADALARLYDRHAPTLLGLARRVLYDTQEAEDVLQEVFLQVWRQAGRYDRLRSSVATWLVLITRSRSIDRLRTRQVRERTVEASRHQSPPTHTSPEGAGNVLSRERRRRLESALEGLPPEQRQVVELAFYRGLTQTEIAERVAIPLGTVKTRTLLAMRKLRAALRDELGELL